MLIHEARGIVDLIMNYNIYVLFGRVLGDVGISQLFRHLVGVGLEIVCRECRLVFG